MIERLKIERCSETFQMNRGIKKESGKKKKKNPRMEKWTADKEGAKRAKRTKDNEGERVGLT